VKTLILISVLQPNHSGSSPKEEEVVITLGRDEFTNEVVQEQMRLLKTQDDKVVITEKTRLVDSVLNG
jgi:hypothetical protein